MSVEEYNNRNERRNIIKILKKSEEEIERKEGIEEEQAFKELRQNIATNIK